MRHLAKVNITGSIPVIWSNGSLPKRLRAVPAKHVFRQFESDGSLQWHHRLTVQDAGFSDLSIGVRIPMMLPKHFEQRT